MKICISIISKLLDFFLEQEFQPQNGRFLKIFINNLIFNKMKNNKKAILGMLVAMVMSLGVIGGVNNAKETPEPTFLISLTADSQYDGHWGVTFYSGLAGFMFGCAIGGPVGGAVGFGVSF